MIKMLLVALALTNHSWSVELTPVAKTTPLGSRAVGQSRTADIEAVWNSEKVAELMGKLLIRGKEFSYAYFLYGKSGQDPYASQEWHRFEKAQSDIFFNQSIEGDCAVVQSLTELNDASGAEDATCAIEIRGMRMLPIITYALAHPIYALDDKDEKARQFLLKECFKRIKTGINFKKCEG